MEKQGAKLEHKTQIEIPADARRISLKKGVKYSFCTCGHSGKIPLCDDTHQRINAEKGTSYKSFKIFPLADCEVMVYSANWIKKE